MQLHYYDRVSILNHCVRRTCPIAKAWTDANIMERETLELGGLGKFGKGKLVSIAETMIFLEFELARHYIIRLTALRNLQHTFLSTKVGSNKTNREENEEEEPTELPPDVISQMVNNGHGEIAVR